jgi:hypothetical protein
MIVENENEYDHSMGKRNFSHVIPDHTKIKLICEMPSSFKLTFNFNFSQISTYDNLIFQLYDYLATLEIDKFSIFLGQLFFITKNMYDPTNPNIIDEEKYEIANEISPENYTLDFIESLSELISRDNQNTDFYLLFKIGEEILEEDELKICEEMINLFLESFNISEVEQKEKLKIFKEKYDNINNILNENFSDEIMNGSSSIKFIKNLLDLKLENFFTVNE